MVGAAGVRGDRRNPLRDLACLRHIPWLAPEGAAVSDSSAGIGQRTAGANTLFLKENPFTYVNGTVRGRP
jgi:hypothetical protein